MSLAPSNIILNESVTFTQSMVKRQNKRYKAKMQSIDDLFQLMCEAQYNHHVNQIGLSVLRDNITHARLEKIIYSLAQYGITVSHIHYRFKLTGSDSAIKLTVMQSVYVGGNISIQCREFTEIVVVNHTQDDYKPKHVKTNHIR